MGLVLINSVLSNMVLYMISFFQLPKGVLKKIDYFVQDSFDKGIVRKRNIDWHGGTWFADLKIKMDLASMIYR